MSRLMTVSELYALLLHEPKVLASPKNSAREAVALRRGSSLLWLKPAAPAAPARQIPVAGSLVAHMELAAQASGLSEGEAWAEAAEHWLVQRRRDMEELASPAGQTLAAAVRRIWSVIDDQMGELRPDREKSGG